jgi:UDP-2,3-diacylglucosamine pyrophosphatase LpxH
MPTTRAPVSPRHHRSLFVSDLHLGALGSRADLLLDFLQRHRADTYYLVGDVLDLWSPLLPFWTEGHQAVLDHLSQRAAEGAEIVHMPGNHDPHPTDAPQGRQLPPHSAPALIHEAANGRRYLVVHGDVVDGRMIRNHAMTRFGSRIDHGLRLADRLLSRLRWRVAPDRRSLVEFLISSVNTLMYMGRGHERKLVALARAEGVDGVICGHFHIAALHDDHGLTYANCGDWMDSFTALAEGFDGRLEIVGGRAALALPPQPVPALEGAVRA